MGELRVEARRGVALVVSTVPQPLLRTATEETAAVEIYVGYDGEDPAKAQLLGSVAPGGTLVREYNPDGDADLRLYQRRLTVTGVPDVAQLLDAESIKLEINRMTAPLLNQRNDATHTTVELGIVTTPRAKYLKVQRSIYADMGVVAEVNPEETIENIPALGVNSLPITRTAPTGSTLTLYVRAATAAGGDYGPWSPIQAITFANSGGSGGSGGDGGFGPGTHIEIEHDET